MQGSRSMLCQPYTPPQTRQAIGWPLKALLFALLLGLAGPALATDAVAAFRDGDFDRVIGMAEEAPQDPDLQALAARALLVQARFTAAPAEMKPAVQAGLARARAAVALAPDHIEGNLQIGVALGLLGRLEGPMAAASAGYAEETRQRLDAVLARDPDNVWAHAMRGAWHLEIVATAGPVLAEALYGATAAKGAAAYRWALALDPDNPVLRYEAAASLLRLDPAGQHDVALTAMRRIAESAPSDALGRLQRDRACRLAALLSDPAAGAADWRRAVLWPTESLAPYPGCAPDSGHDRATAAPPSWADDAPAAGLD